MEVKSKACPFKFFGCPVKLSEDLLEKHIEEDVHTHLSLVEKTIKLERSQKDFQKEAIQVATRRCRTADGENMQLRKQLQALQQFEQLATGSIDESKCTLSKNEEKAESKDKVTVASTKLQKLLQEHKDISEEVKKLKLELAQQESEDHEVVNTSQEPPYLSADDAHDPMSMPVSGIFGRATRTRPSITPGEKLVLNTKPFNLNGRPHIQSPKFASLKS